MANYTLTYGDGIKGWPSFYSFYPDWMIGMNNYFYSFKGGNLYRHNVNPVHNTFYGQYTPSSLTAIFNDSPLENKLFKTINLESDDAWDTVLESDIQATGFINKEYYEKKEQSWYAFIRNSDGGVNDYVLRSLNGIGNSDSISGIPSATEVAFTLDISIGSIISVGDSLFYLDGTPVFFGVVTQVNVDLPNGINQIVVDASTGAVPPLQSVFIFYVKNSIAESHGILGHYCKFTITNDSTSQTELYAVETEVFKSYP